MPFWKKKETPSPTKHTTVESSSPITLNLRIIIHHSLMQLIKDTNTVCDSLVVDNVEVCLISATDGVATLKQDIGKEPHAWASFITYQTMLPHQRRAAVDKSKPHTKNIIIVSADTLEELVKVVNRDALLVEAVGIDIKRGPRNASLALRKETRNWIASIKFAKAF